MPGVNTQIIAGKMLLGCLVSQEGSKSQGATAPRNDALAMIASRRGDRATTTAMTGRVR
jgi:hypothetical protein